MTDLEAFRADTRAWLEANCPAEMRQPIRSEADMCWGGRNWTFQSDAQRQWLEATATRGWTVPDWPEDYGGGGLSAEQAVILKEEMQRIGARPKESSRVDERKRRAQPLRRKGLGVAGGPWHRRDDRASRARNSIE